MSQSEYNFKIVLLGEGIKCSFHWCFFFKIKWIWNNSGRVGKTSIVLRYCRGAFDDKQQQTVQASFQTKTLNIENKRTHLAVWVNKKI